MTPKTWKDLMNEAAEDQKRQEKPAPTPQQLLAMEIDSQDGRTYTLLQYLTELNAQLFAHPRGFDGTKPLGEVNWKVQDLAYSMIINDFIDGRLDEEGNVKEYSSAQFKERIDSVFELLRNADPSSIQLPPEPKEWFLVDYDISDPKNLSIDGLYSNKLYTKSEAKALELAQHETAFGATITRKAVKLTL